MRTPLAHVLQDLDGAPKRARALKPADAIDRILARSFFVSSEEPQRLAVVIPLPRIR